MPKSTLKSTILQAGKLILAEDMIYFLQADEVTKELLNYHLLLQQI